MNTCRTWKGRSLTLGSLGLCLLLLATLSACGSTSSEIEFVPSEVTAQFAVFQNITDTGSASPSTSVHAGAIFYRGVNTQTVKDGSVEVVIPGGTAYPMAVLHNSLGAPYYTTTLPSFQRGETYRFRVTLPDGTTLENHITTPGQELEITSPTPAGTTLPLNDYLQVSWSGSGAGNVAIVIRRAGTDEIFSVMGLGRIQAPDNGSFDGSGPLNPVFVADAREVGDAGTGTRYLTVTRKTSTSGQGQSYANHLVQASLIYARQVEIQQ